MRAVTLLLDSDIIAYKFAAAHQETYKWDPETTSVSVGELSDAIRQAADYIEELREELKATDLVVCLSCPTIDGWRKAILPTYKEGRGVKPELLAGVKQWMREHYPFYERPTMEADDIMGILATHPNLVTGKRIIVSEDKDMETIPCFLYNPRKDTGIPRFIPEELANHKHMMQTLTGDPTDNYKGCPGIGDVKASKALLGCTTVEAMWEAVVTTYESKGYTEDDALLQARVARICRHTDYDYSKKEVILWQPPRKQQQ